MEYSFFVTFFGNTFFFFELKVKVAMVAAGSGSSSVSGGVSMQHCLLLSVQGDVYAWGDGSRGKLGTVCKIFSNFFFFFCSKLCLFLTYIYI